MAHPNRKPRSDRDLRVITDRLFYKWRMLIFVESALQESETQNHVNVYIESGAIHARTLVHFLFGEKSGYKVRPADAIAWDFFHDTREWNPELPACLEYTRFGVFADKQIAHLGYVDIERWKGHPISQGHFGWDFTLIMDAIQPILEEFMAKIALKKLGDRWKSLENYPEPRWDGLKQIIKKKLQVT